MLFQFVEELSHAFPEEPKLKLCVAQLPMLTEANPKKAMEVFLHTYAPFAHKINAQDESLFADVPSLVGYVDVQQLWQRADQATRAAIWQYMQTLYFMASTVSVIPAHLLSQIESVAQNCATKIETGEMDMSQFLGSLPSVMGQLGLGLHSYFEVELDFWQAYRDAWDFEIKQLQQDLCMLRQLHVLGSLTAIRIRYEPLPAPEPSELEYLLGIDWQELPLVDL
ncbi:hypothetical protein OEZ85_002353 [Tetradesmus obliquus]|uniref:Uncharacterized protein n=1 Tax=Tetradesmus obliquus TaxID=3088 RepID=A0ABY8U6X2_TETOB|nr:hypothetical protein OEZ85_002353 [Tetradesmus obliquus]